MNSVLTQLKQQFEVLAEIDLSAWDINHYETSNHNPSKNRRLASPSHHSISILVNL